MGFPENLKRYRKAAKLTQEQLALACGWSGQSRISNYESGLREPTLIEVASLAEALGVDAADLLAASDRAMARQMGWADIQGYAQAVGLGKGAEAQEYAETHKLKFRAESLSRKGLRPAGLAVMYGQGDSMTQRIHPGDAVLFDTGDTRPRDGSIFVIQWKGEIYAKRAMVLEDAVYFAADNPAGDHNWRKPKRMDAKRDPIHILGRVRWIGSWED